jgi:hypothetical protein
MTRRFYELAYGERDRLRAGIALAGGEDIDYLPCGWIQVALPVEGPMGCVRKIELLGFRERGGHYFPLGSDKAPARLRHYGPGTGAAPRGERPGYWLYWTFELRDQEVSDEGAN